MRPATRLGVWLLLVALSSFVVYRGSWAEVLHIAVNPGQVIDDHLVHAWGVLALCVIGVGVKSPEIASAVRSGPGRGPRRLAWAGLGLGCFAASPLLFEPAPLLVGTVGLWTSLFGRAGRWPSILLGIYLLGSGFPLVAESVGARVFEAATVVPTYAALQALGIPVTQAGAELTIIDPVGRPLSVLVTAACAAPSTIGIFLSLFAWMVLDLPLPLRWLAGLFLLGLAGTYLQNLGRVIGLLVVGHVQGSSALWAAHADAGYPMFIAWYAVYVLFYFWVASLTPPDTLERGQARL